MWFTLNRPPITAAPNEKDPPAISPRVLYQFWRNCLILKKGFGSGGTLPALFAENYMDRPHLTPVRSRNMFLLKLTNSVS
jgi:hypothetical protein